MVLNQRIRQALDLDPSTEISWTSPLAQDEFAEYRDDNFIRLTGIQLPRRALEKFWPRRGPQWDALVKVGTTGALLVEAKANISETVSPGTAAEGYRLTLIERSLSEAKAYLGIDPGISWSGKFYQYANRLAHPYLLRELNGQDAYLAFVHFMGDADVDGPETAAEWRAALTVAKRVLGLPENHRLSRYVAEVYIEVSDIGRVA